LGAATNKTAMRIVNIGLVTLVSRQGAQFKHKINDDGAGRVLRFLYPSRNNQWDSHVGKLAALARTQPSSANPVPQVTVRAVVGATYESARRASYYCWGVIPSPCGGEFLDLRPVEREEEPQEAPLASPAGAVAASQCPELPFGLSVAGWVYVVRAQATDLRVFFYVGSTAGNENDPLRRPRKHFGHEGCLLKRLPPSVAISHMAVISMFTVGRPDGSCESNEVLMNRAESETVCSLIQSHGPQCVRGADILQMYGEPLTSDQQDHVKHLFSLPY